MVKPPVLASAAELDDRLKRVDEPRWLASRYAPAGRRRILVGLGLLATEIRRAMGMPEAMLGRIRVQWWREAMEDIWEGRAIRRHDLVEELAGLLDTRGDLAGSVSEYLDAADAVLEDHLAAGGHVADDQHAVRHVEVEAAWLRLAARVLEPDLDPDDANRLYLCAAGGIARQADLPNAADSWKAASSAFSSLTPAVVPAAVHLAVVSHETSEHPLRERWRVFFAVLTRSLPTR